MLGAGLVAPVVGQNLMGETGELLVALMILMAVTSTGSAEVIAVTSILIYDIYQVYLKVSELIPLRLVLPLSVIRQYLTNWTQDGYRT